jgi:hypothetical protein
VFSVREGRTGRCSHRTLVPASLSKIDETNVRCLPLAGQTLTTQIALAWRRTDNCKAALHLVGLLSVKPQ